MATQAPSAAAVVARLEARARAAHSPAELAFSIANDSFGLLGFRQAFVLAGSGAQARLQALSGLALPSEDSPYLIWLRRNWPWMQQRLADQAGWLPSRAAADGDTQPAADIPAEVLDGWREWWPLGLQALPLRRRDGVILGWVGFLLEQPPTPVQMQALAHLAVHWGYCWEMLGGKPRRSLGQRWQALGRKRHAVWLAVLLLCLIPIRQSALAPAEIVALDATTVSAPLDGVVKTLHVRPNQPVQAGDLLLSLDDTTLRNRLEVATQSLAVAEAEWMSASQKAFDSVQSKGEITLLQGRVQEKRAELAAVQSQLERTDVTAPHAGLSVYGSPDDWIGRPVTTGERILQVANPESAGVLIHLPVADALVLDAQAKVRLFLTVKPLSPLDATVTETSYQATLSPDGVASYRLRATLDAGQALGDARIGLHGTAKIAGDWVPLIYYVLRRPLATLREWSGW
ncbi:MAG: HlyD family efflux transporter periplasmic adaptor subunit [Comamonas sp.]